jgi:cytochrome c oxidase subunit 2
MQKPFAKILVILCCLIGLPAQAEHAVNWQWNFIPPASTVMERVEHLHTHLFYMITAIVVFVFLLLCYVCIRFRRSANPTPSKTIHHVMLEVVWTVLPIIILLIVAVPSFRLLYFTDSPVENPEMTLKVVGHQWYWEYIYPDHDAIQFDSYLIKEADLKPGQLRLLEVDNPVILPVDTTIRILLTSADVIHAWAMPAFGLKKDAVPGHVNETWVRITKPGTYYGQCSELCGVGHGFMPIKVEAVSKEEYQQWLETAKKKFAAS